MLLGKVPRYLKWCISIYGTKKFYGIGPRLECTASIGSVYWQSFQVGIIGIFLKLITRPVLTLAADKRRLPTIKPMMDAMSL